MWDVIYVEMAMGENDKLTQYISATVHSPTVLLPYVIHTKVNRERKIFFLQNYEHNTFILFSLCNPTIPSIDSHCEQYHELFSVWYFSIILPNQIQIKSKWLYNNIFLTFYNVR